MIDEVEYLIQKLKGLNVIGWRRVLDEFQLVPKVVEDISARVKLQLDEWEQANKALRVPEAAKHMGVSAYIIRRWLERGKLKNENPSEGNVLISIRQLEDLRVSEPNMVMRKQKKVRAVPAGARDFRKIAN